MKTNDLFEWAKTGEAEKLKQNLESDPDLLGIRDDTGATLLHYAALHGHRNIVRFLIDRGADPNILDREFGATPTGWAIEYLRELGGLLAIEIDDLAYAIDQKDERWVKRLIQRFPHLKDQADSDGVPLKEKAKLSGSGAITDLLH